MEYYRLFDYNSTDWLNIESQLNEVPLEKLNDIRSLISRLGNFIQDRDDFKQNLKTIDVILERGYYKELELVDMFERIKRFALKLPKLFADGRICRLGNRKYCSSSLQLTRLQVLCLLCHMTLCTLKSSKHTLYWVTFQNWLNDGRTCAVAYLRTLFEYFRQTFSIESLETDPFMNESILFKRNSVEDDVEKLMAANSSSICSVRLHLDGSIDDAYAQHSAQVDFANCDIGYGVTGTQEEMLFGASPELCVSMLFCNTLEPNEAICICGPRKVAIFDGYGLNVTVRSFLELNETTTRASRQRRIIAIDALNLSDEYQTDLLFGKQLSIENLSRELIKAYAGFSFIKFGKIATGHWGCGSFAGHKQLKALVQFIAASLTQNELEYYCYGDVNFQEDFSHFMANMPKNLTTLELWRVVVNLKKELDKIERENIFKFIIDQKFSK
jgi:hypothetical protein